MVNWWRFLRPGRKNMEHTVSEAVCVHESHCLCSDGTVPALWGRPWALCPLLILVPTRQMEILAFAPALLGRGLLLGLSHTGGILKWHMTHQRSQDQYAEAKCGWASVSCCCFSSGQDRALKCCACVFSLRRHLAHSSQDELRGYGKIRELLFIFIVFAKQEKGSLADR